MGQSGTQSTVTQAADPWYKYHATDLFAKGLSTLNNTPYSPYPGSGVAGFQPAQLAAQDWLTRSFLGQSLPYNSPQTYGPSYPAFDPFVNPSLQASGAGGQPGQSFYGGGYGVPPAAQSQMAAIQAPAGQAPTAQATTAGAVAPPPAPPFTNLPGVTPPTGGEGKMFGDYNLSRLNELLNTGGYGAKVLYPGEMSYEEYLVGKTPDNPQQFKDDFYGQWMKAPNEPTYTPTLWRQHGTLGWAPDYSFANPEHMAEYFNDPAMLAQAHANYQIARDPTQPPVSPGEYERWQEMYEQQQQQQNQPPAGTPPGTLPPPPGGTPGGPVAMPNTGAGGGTGINEAQQAANVARQIAAGGTQNVAAGDLLAGINRYRDPYESDVVNTTLQDLERSRQLATMGDRSRATLSGAFGGDRAALLEAETNRGYADVAARTAAQLRSQGFDRAAGLAEGDASRGLTAGLANQGAFFTGRDQQLQGAGLLSALGGDIYGRTLGVGQALAGIGAEQQGQAQDVIGADQAQYYDAQEDPYRRFGFLSGLLTGVPQDMRQTTYTPRGSRGAGFAGGAMSGAAIGATLGLPAGGIGAIPAALLGGLGGGLLGLL